MSRYIIYFHPGDPVPDRMKYVDDGIVAPDADDDGATLGVTVGSLWIDGVAHRVYLCEDASTGAAVWTELTGGGGTGSSSSTLDVDLTVTGAYSVDGALAATHDLTLTGDSTLTPTHSDPTAGEAIDMRLLIRQDGTGSRTLAWGGTITWVGGSAPTMPTAADAMMTVGLLSVDDGSTWLGYFDQTGGGGDPATTVESETTFGITPAVGTDTEYARQDHTHGTPADPVTIAALSALGLVGTATVSEGITDPPELVWSEDGSDFIYSEVGQ